MFPTTRFRYDTPLHDLERDDWSDEARFDLRRGSGRSLGHRHGKRPRSPAPRPRWSVPKSPWSRRRRAPWGPLAVLPFRPELDIDCRCRSERDEAYRAEPESAVQQRLRQPEEEVFSIGWGPLSIGVNWSRLARIDFPASGPPGRKAFEDALYPKGTARSGGVYVMMDPRDEGVPWYVGQTVQESVATYLYNRCLEAHRLGGFGGLCNGRLRQLLVYRATIDVTPRSRKDGKKDIWAVGAWGRRGKLVDAAHRLVEAVLVKLLISDNSAALSGNTGSERKGHMVFGTDQTVTINLSNCPFKLPDKAKFHRAKWDKTTGVFEISPTIRKPTVPTFELSPFTFP